MARGPASLADLLVGQVDNALRTLSGRHVNRRPSPARELAETELEPEAGSHAAGLMRVNHTGEICAQALYQGQAATARDPQVRSALLEAAAEEADHLAWCEGRLAELDSRPSVLNPAFYALSYMMGAVTGLLGDRVSLGFVEATEDQVVRHLEEHLEALPAADVRSREIVARMREDEARHGSEALERGGVEFPAPVKHAMTLLSRVMTETTYRL
ncbi:MAG: 2-polyprenyl-3-methyl-6-methoxy-1,4-benzoquinone monooxygenase [Pseudomonadales bacterium]